MLKDAYMLALREAYLQLDWGTDPDEMSAAAAALQAVEPAHDILSALAHRIRRAREVAEHRQQEDRACPCEPAEAFLDKATNEATNEATNKVANRSSKVRRKSGEVGSDSG